jgi:phosphatase NudJ
MKSPFIRLSASAVAQRDTDGRFLFIEESIGGRLVLDILGGTWEQGETLQETCIREAAEEASIQFIPMHYLGCFVTEYTNGRGNQSAASAQLFQD